MNTVSKFESPTVWEATERYKQKSNSICTFLSKPVNVHGIKEMGERGEEP